MSKQCLDKFDHYNSPRLAPPSRLDPVEPFSPKHPFGFSSFEKDPKIHRMISTQNIVIGETILVEQSFLWNFQPSPFTKHCFLCGKCLEKTTEDPFCSGECDQSKTHRNFETEHEIYTLVNDETNINGQVLCMTIQYISLLVANNLVPRDLFQQIDSIHDHPRYYFGMVKDLIQCMDLLPDSLPFNKEEDLALRKL